MQYDLHVHSSYSFDCKSDVGAVIRTARDRGLDGVAIVDHDTVEGGVEGMALAPHGFLVIPGMEINTEIGDLVGLFLKDKVGAERDPHAFIAGVHAQGGIVFMPHPLRYGHPLDESVLSEIDALEGFNARSARVRRVDPKYGEPGIRALAEGYRLPTIAGSDAHVLRHIGRGRTIIPAQTAEEVKAQILKGRTILAGRRVHPLAVLAGRVGQICFQKGKRFLRGPESESPSG
jgi:predicted metal-dependent phosphoesterase TrpH